MIKKCWMVLLGLLVLLANTQPVQATEKVTLYLTDALGSPVAQMDASGNVTYEAAYRPYGQQAEGTPQDGPGYTGHVNDTDTGLVYMQARYYDPGVGRFISVDPVTPSAGDVFNFNRFGYADNSPVDRIDPTGKASVGVKRNPILAKQNGRVAENKVNSEMASKGQSPTKNVTFKDPQTGSSSRVDATHVSDDGKVTVRETKANSSPVRPNQENVLRSIARGDAVPVGSRAAEAGLTPGVPVGQQAKSLDVGVSRVPVSGGQPRPITETPIVAPAPTPGEMVPDITLLELL